MIATFLRYVYDTYYILQIQALFRFLQVEYPEGYIVTFDLPFQKRTISFPFHKKTSLKDKFIVMGNTDYFIQQHKINVYSNAGWVCLYQSPFLYIAKKRDNPQQEKMPYYYGVSKEEQDEILRVTRIYFIQLCKQQDVSTDSDLLDRFTSPAELDVGIWVCGELRGSVIVKGVSLTDALMRGVMATYHDTRFKPLTLEEIESMYIEVTLLSPLRMPLLHKEILANSIYHDKSYLLLSGNLKAWFLPMAYNSVNFKDLDHLLRELYIKAKVLPSSKVSVYNVQTHVFVEDVPGGKSVDLNGPVPKVIPSLELSDIYKSGERAATFLMYHQDKDGFVPTNISPITGSKGTHMDSVRFIFSVYGLLVWADFTNDIVVRARSLISYKYCTYLIIAYYQIENADTLLLIYYLKCAYLLKEDDYVLRIEKEVLRRVSFLPYESITYIQLALFCLETIPRDRHRLEIAKEVTTKILNEYYQNRDKVDIASYADLVFLLHILAKEDSYYASIYKEVFTWTMRHQLVDGSFAAVPYTYTSHTRGTSKVLESLTALISYEDEVVQRCFAWIYSMCYVPTGMYYIPIIYHEKYAGGLRLNYWSTSVSTDTIAHYLIAITRVFTRNKGDE